jgi:hypothetical protein
MFAKCFTSLVLFTLSTVTVASGKHGKSKDPNQSIQVLIFETLDDEVSTLATQIHERINGIDIKLFGSENGFKGYGSKFVSVLPILRDMDKDSLVVIADSRDVLVNNPYNDDTYTNVLADEFRMAFEELTYENPGSIVISAEAQCCVSALTHAAPGSFFTTDGSRNQFSCSSGESGCLWNGDDKARPWEMFMKKLMLQRTSGDRNVYDDMYLNAGLIAGRVQDLIRVITKSQIQSKEDDQAVLTDYMYRFPNEIILDYGQTMFGNNRAGVVGLSNEAKCTFAMGSQQNRLYHSKTGTTPLFVHSPGGFYECHDSLSKVLGVPELTSADRRRWLTYKKKNCNYGKGTSSLQSLLGASSANEKPVTSLESYLKRSSPTSAPVSSLSSLLPKRVRNP